MEISIVIVITGLLIGGILVGQSLIESSKISKTISELQQYEIAFKQFKTKFRYFPGDEPASYGFSPVQRFCGAGNTACAADGVINTIYGVIPSNISICSSGNSEIAASWLHLTEAKFLQKSFGGCVGGQQITGTTHPKLALGGGLGVYGETDGTVHFITSVERTAGNEAYAFKGGNAFTVKQTYAIDNKLDDGMPNTGRAQQRTSTGNWSQNAAWMLNASGCVNSTADADTYNLNSNYQCALRITLDR